MNFNEFKQMHTDMGKHFFSKDTMKFWGSDIKYWDDETGYFITSEDNFEGTKKLYTIRKADFVSGNVYTIGEFQAHKTLQKAKATLDGIMLAHRCLSLYQEQEEKFKKKTLHWKAKK